MFAVTNTVRFCSIGCAILHSLSSLASLKIELRTRIAVSEWPDLSRSRQVSITGLVRSAEVLPPSSLFTNS